ncbi:MAG: hypothetical protein OQJ97_15050 [Rhodospirillales bacterium]|nr:hypothetical protein [Rhodospirillales bacterium]
MLQVTSKNVGRFLVLTAAAFTLSACVTQGNLGQDEGIGFRQARFEQISVMRDYRKCKDEALNLDQKARASGEAARYLSSARLLEKCEAEIGPDAAGAAKGERLRAYALSIQNYFKGGDVAKARENLQKLKQAHPRADLYFADGSSFVETMEVLLGMKDKGAIAKFSVANVNGELKSELRRVRYWKRN